MYGLLFQVNNLIISKASLKNISVGANINLKLMVRLVGFFFLSQVQLGQSKRTSVLADTDTVTAKKFDFDSYKIQINKQFLQLVTG